MFDDYEFALCLTHDIDRPYKAWPQALYYALADRQPSHLLSMLPERNPYWQFETIMAVEDDFDVRSAFYFLNEPDLLRDKSPVSWFRSENWIQQLGRYDITDEAIVDVIHTLDRGGWEIGIHGSYHSYADQFRLAYEKAVLESLYDGSILGGRQHYLNLDRPQTWQYHAELGLRYDASLGSSTSYGFTNGYGVKRPFDNSFVVFPLTIMEVALPDPGTKEDEAIAECDRLLREAAENDAVMTILWHLRYFNEDEFPGYLRLYRYIIERAQELNAWIGPPGELYPHVAKPPDSTETRPKTEL
ncbi:polysaccharide deacetylase family protein [Halocatena marina]|uniref:polysaccharide deacetylase family protein n=1 Tax=Halocatena marina TaxID=2934937 RepID=UPI00200D44DF|nr:polysaccharide deacetylase family protein [Halocatena marina]